LGDLKSWTIDELAKLVKTRFPLDFNQVWGQPNPLGWIEDGMTLTEVVLTEAWLLASPGVL
jgi:hypothetical protein